MFDDDDIAIADLDTGVLFLFFENWVHAYREAGRNAGECERRFGEGFQELTVETVIAVALCVAGIVELDHLGRFSSIHEFIGQDAAGAQKLAIFQEYFIDDIKMIATLQVGC